MANAFFADISAYQNPTIGADYWPWSASGDGITRLICKATEGVGFQDKNFVGYWQQATAAGAGMIVPYHYARADLNFNAATEAQWFAKVIGSALRSEDRVMLDFEQNESLSWAHAFYDALPPTLLKNKPVLYDSVSHFNQFFAADLSLAAKYDCALAAYPPQMQAPPAAPPGWHILWWQFTDNDTQQPRIIMPVPGISMPVDVNMWLGAALPSFHTQGGKMLIKHPTIAGRFDLFYVNNNILRHFILSSLSDLTQNLQNRIDYGNPGQETMKPDSLSVVWDDTGQTAAIVVAATSGLLYSFTMRLDGESVTSWAPLASGVSIDVPSAVPDAEPLAQKIIASVAALG